MLFINTRPEDRAVSLTQALSNAGYEVANLPLLELVDEPWSDALQQLYQQLEQVQVIVVVSPTAVDVGMRYLQRAGIHLDQLIHIQWIAVGQTTAQALAKFHIRAVVPEVETSEGMLELPILKQQKNVQKIAFWRGLGGRQFMMQQLQQQGVVVLNFVLYRRECPVASQTQFVNICAKASSGQQIVVLITSEASWNNWQQLCEKKIIDVEWIYLVLGERLRKIVEHTQSQLSKTVNIIQLESLSALEIIQRMKDWQGNV